MAVLGKDIFDLYRPHTHTKIQFGDKGYWVEWDTDCLPYGSILTEILNCSITDYCAKLSAVEQSVAARDPEQLSERLEALVRAFMKLPLYRLYILEPGAIEPALVWKSIEAGRHSDLIAETLKDPDAFLLKYIRARDDILYIQERYGWFLESLFEGQPFEKKKGQKKIPLAKQLTDHFLEALVSGVSLGEDNQIDAPQVNIQYAVLEPEGCQPELVEKMYFDRLLDFVYVELMRGMQKGFVHKRCANCGRWFLQYPGATYAYCDGPAPGQEDKTCREIGATASFQEKVRNNEIWKLHQRAYKKYFARTRKGTMSKPEFEKWARDAERLRDRALKSYEISRTLEEKNRILDKLKADLNCV